jgi:tetratricopeptide (TPR) repeat protein
MPDRADESRAAPHRGGFSSFLTIHSPLTAAAVGAACFITALANDFTYDDNYIVRDNPRIRSLTDARALWLSDWWYKQPDEPVLDPRRDRLYRPLTLFSFALNYAALGLWPAGFLALNVILHATACSLLSMMVARVFQDRTIATVAALLFAAHPLHCEAVANVVGRAEVLATVLLLAGLLVLVGAHRAWPTVGRSAAAAVLFFLALLAKETAVCYPAIVAVVLHETHAARGRNVRSLLLRAAILLAPIAIYLPLRAAALEGSLMARGELSALFNPLFLVHDDLLRRMLAAFTVLGHYVRLTLLPQRLSCDYGYAIIDPLAAPDAMTLLGLAASAGLFVALLGYRRRSGVWRQLAVSAAMWLASYALISNTAILIGVAVAERLAYWPSVPALMLVGAAVVGAWRRYTSGVSAPQQRSPVGAVILGLVIAALGVRTIVRNPDWSSDERLFTTDVVTYPQGAHLNSNCAQMLFNRAALNRSREEQHELLTQADKHLQTALRIYPRFPEALRTRGRVLAVLGDTAGAIACLEAALDLEPRDRIAAQVLAELRSDEAGAERTAELLARVAAAPDELAARLELCELLQGSGRHGEALEQARAAVRIAPDNAAALRLLGQSLALNHDPPGAIAAFYRVLAIDPADWESRVNLSTVLASIDRTAALEQAREAHRLRPDDLRTNINLAEALAINGQVDEALRLFRRVERGLPADHPRRSAIVDRIRELERQRP